MTALLTLHATTMQSAGGGVLRSAALDVAPVVDGQP